MSYCMEPSVCVVSYRDLSSQRTELNIIRKEYYLTIGGHIYCMTLTIYCSEQNDSPSGCYSGKLW